MEKAENQLELILKYFSAFDDKQLSQLNMLNELYHDWNSKINVISRKDIDSLYEKHVLHSLSIAAVFNFPPGAHVIDIGTGGGFPGVPLAIFFPEVQFHLVDSIGKKLKVIEAVVEATQLTNITVQHTRAEEIKNRKFDYVVSRAVAPLRDLWTWGRPLLRKRIRPEALTNEDVIVPLPGLICLKGGDLSSEISESGLRPRMIELIEIFSEPFFEEKYLLHVAL
jgi:16S rRNA (guanine527-N7)-methyltransferase